MNYFKFLLQALLFFVCTENAYSENNARNGPYFKKLEIPKSRNCKEKNVKTISFMNPPENQGSLGYCHTFAATALLNQFHCNKTNGKGLGCFNSRNRDLRFSKFDVASIGHDGELPQLGWGNQSLRRISENLRPISLEQCAPFEDIKIKKFDPNNKYDEYGQGYITLEKIYQKLKSIFEINQCFDKKNINIEIGEVTNLSTKIAQLIRFSIDARNFDHFLSLVLIPSECKNTARKPYPFKVESRYGNIKGLKNIISIKIKENKPVAYTFCMAKKKDGSCNGSHAITIVGTKKICCKNNFLIRTCETLFKVRNSYGKSWQDEYDDGWIMADNLLKHRDTSYSNYSKRIRVNNIYWIEDP